MPSTRSSPCWTVTPWPDLVAEPRWVARVATLIPRTTRLRLRADPMTADRPDIISRHDIVRLVDTFYDRVRADDILGSIFDEVARVDWAGHLPKMYAFWDAVLFGTAGFKGNPLGVHLQLAQLTSLGSREFGRWIELFHFTVDALFSGPMADEAKARASRIAIVMQHHIIADQGLSAFA